MQMFTLSPCKLSMESKKFLYKSCKAHQPKEGFEMNSQNYAVIWSHMSILSQSKLSMESSYFTKVLKLTSLRRI